MSTRMEGGTWLSLNKQISWQCSWHCASMSRVTCVSPEDAFGVEADFLLWKRLWLLSFRCFNSEVRCCRNNSGWYLVSPTAHWTVAGIRGSLWGATALCQTRRLVITFFDSVSSLAGCGFHLSIDWAHFLPVWQLWPHLHHRHDLVCIFLALESTENSAKNGCNKCCGNGIPERNSLCHTSDQGHGGL